jgi:GNAT superfamily N-acetyltransferase
MKFVLLPCTSEDHSFLAQLFQDVRSHEFASLGLPEPVLEQLLSMQFRAQSTSYAAQFPDAVDQIVWIGSNRAGRVLVNRSDDAIQLIDIALLAQYRSQGIGTLLLQGLCEEARSSGKPLRLSVRFGSPAEHLYERAGFVRTGTDGVNIAMEYKGNCEEVQFAAEESPLSSELVGPVEQGLTGRYFRTLVGQRMTGRGDDGTIVQLVLEAVHLLRSSKRGAAVESGDSFVLSFSGPSSPMLGSAEATITPANADPMGIFLVPLGISDGTAKYEAVFNRMRQL